MSLPVGFYDETVFEDLEEPTTLRFAPDGRIFVTEKPGKILVFDSLEDSAPTEFADIRGEVYDTGDRGLLGLALDPEFPERPYVYALYTYDHLLGEEASAPKWGTLGQSGDPCPKPEEADVDACPVSARLVRMEAVGDHAVEEEVDEEQVPAETVLVEDWCQQFSSHSIGDLEFDSEGNLYASGGDGASFTNTDYGQFGWPEKNQCGDPPGEVGDELTPPTAEGGALRSQNNENLDGTVIRVDPDTGQGVPGNPMFSSLNANERRVVAFGFRNPFRFAVDGATNEVYVGNVGWERDEEIDRFSPSANPAFNSGWPCWEGPEPSSPYAGLELNVCVALYEEPSSTALPFLSYDHAEPVTLEDTCPTQFGSAVGGLDFYEGEAFPDNYRGALFFSDPVRGCIYVMFAGEDGRPDPSTTIPFLTDGGVFPGIDIQEGPEENLYYVKLFDDAYGPGSIHRIAYDSENQPPVARLTVDSQWGEAPLDSNFDASGSTDANGEQLQFEWDLDGDGQFGDAPAVDTASATFEGSENHTVAVRVTDEQEASSVARLTVYPGDTPPEPEIVEPSGSLEWHVGQQIHFAGAAEDGEDGTLPATSLGWSSRLYHCPSSCHAHPLQAFPAVASGFLMAPDHDYPAQIELKLTVTDSRGLAATATVQIDAHPVELSIDSSPPGVTLTAGGSSMETPFVVTAIEDSQVTLSAPSSVELGGTAYAWQAWSDGGERVHSIVAGESGQYEATYSAVDTQSPAQNPPAGGDRDRDPPQTKLRKHPPKVARSGYARFAFSADERGSRFQCKLDGKPTRSCSSPREYKHLMPGRHAFKVSAIDIAGTVDPTPSVFRWKVLSAR